MTHSEALELLDQMAIAEDYYEGEELIEKMRQIILQAEQQHYERMSE